jgi:hypothetical protein
MAGACAVLLAARPLALVAENALTNGDPRRARAALHDRHEATTSGGILGTAAAKGG